MKIDVRMLNLLGLLVIVAVLGLGLSMIVMPMYQQVQAATSEVSTAESTNDNYRAKIKALADAEGRRGEIDLSIEELRAQLPATPEGESAIRVIADAVKKFKVDVLRDTFAEPVAFAPREAASTDGSAATPPASPQASQDAPAAGSDAGSSGGAAASAPAEPAVDPKQQTTVTLDFAVADESTARKFLQELQQGQRLLLITDAKFSGGVGGKSSGPGSGTSNAGALSVTLQMFNFTEAQ